MSPNKYWNFLEALRQSGITNMYGSDTYLAEAFDISEAEARSIVIDWMNHYNPDDYKDM